MAVLRRTTLLAVALLTVLSFLLLFHSRALLLESVVSSVQRSILPPLHPEPVPDQFQFGSIVVAATNDSDLKFTRAFKAKWNLFLYNVDEPNPADARLRIPANKGNEAMVYLSWLVNNYDDLPWCVIMLHGHAYSWHQLDNINILVQDINLVKLAEIGYISFQCSWFPSCPRELRPIDRDAVAWGDSNQRDATEEALAGNWKLMFPNEPLPRTIASQCCAQFAITRAAIRRRPKADYERLREWLLDSLLDDQFSGRVLEKLWAYIFTGESVHCPHPQQCACEYFGQCYQHDFEQPPKGLPQIGAWP